MSINTNKSHMSWDRAFQEAATAINNQDSLMKITNELFPNPDGSLRENWIGLTREQRDEIYNHIVENE